MVTRTWRTVVLLAGETAVLAFAVALGSYLRLQDGDWTLQADLAGMLRVLLIVVVCQACLHYADLYDLRTIVDTRDLLVRLLQALGATSLILAAIYFWLPDWVIGRGVFLYAAVLIISLILAWRLFFTWLTKHAAPRERLLLVGTNPASVALARELFERRQELGVEIVGFVDPDPSRVGAPVINPGVIGTIDDIPSLVRATQRGPRRGEPERGPRPAADGSAARHPPAERRQLRSSGVRLRGIHGQDRGREPPPELVHLLRWLPQDARIDGRQASVRPRAVAGRPGGGSAADGGRRRCS